MTTLKNNKRKPGELWRYVFGGKVAHYVKSNSANEAICGVWIFASHLWRGTGSQEELDTLDSLPECKNCIKRLDRVDA